MGKDRKRRISVWRWTLLELLEWSKFCDDDVREGTCEVFIFYFSGTNSENWSGWLRIYGPAGVGSQFWERTNWIKLFSLCRLFITLSFTPILAISSSHCKFCPNNTVPSLAILSIYPSHPIQYKFSSSQTPVYSFSRTLALHSLYPPIQGTPLILSHFFFGCR